MTQRVIKFRRAYFNYDGSFYGFKEWGPQLEGDGFVGPSYIHGCKSGPDQQYSGLKDKHGKEIYEHDIVRLTNDPNQVQRKSIVSEIGFLDGSFCALWRKTELWEGYNVPPSSVVFLNSISSNQMEKIGDIYTTPELVDPKMIENGNS